MISRQAAIVSGFVQNRVQAIDIARQPDRQITQLQGGRIECGHAVGVELDAQILKLQRLKIGMAPDGGQNPVKLVAFRSGQYLHGVLADGFKFDFDAGGYAQVVAQDVHHAGVDFGIADTGNPFGMTEAMHLQTQMGQALAQFGTDGAQADHGHAPAQVGLLEKIIGRQYALSQRLPGLGHKRPAAGGDDDAFSADALAVDLQGVGIKKTCLAINKGIAQGLGQFDRPADEAITQATNMGQHGGYVRLQVLGAVDSGLGLLAHLRQGVSRIQQGLGGHAADPRAGGAERAVIDQNDVIAVALGVLQGGQSGRTGTDDGELTVTCHWRSPGPGLGFGSKSSEKISFEKVLPSSPIKARPNLANGTLYWAELPM